MSAKQTKKKNHKNLADNRYLLKLVIALILGYIWVRVSIGGIIIPIPIGLIVGLLLISKNKLKTDKKIVTAVLLVSMLIGYWAQTGLYISL